MNRAKSVDEVREIIVKYAEKYGFRIVTVTKNG